MRGQFLLVLLLVSVSSQGCLRGCFECDLTSKLCSACYDGYQLTILGECVKNSIVNCNLYLDQTLCMRCLSTYTLTNNTCVKDLSGCYRYLTTDTCARCSSELTLVQGICRGVFNCLNYTDRCIRCSQGFKLQDNLCVVSDGNCKQSDARTGVCQICKEGYDLIGYRCVSGMFYNPNCEFYNEIGECFLCKQGYVLHGGNCYGKKQLETLKIISSNNSGAKNTTKNDTVAVNPEIAVEVSVGSANSTARTVENKTISSNNNSVLEKQPPKNTTNASLPSDTSPKREVQAELTTFLNNLNQYCQNFIRGVCVQCYQGYYLNNNMCVQIDPLCRNFNFTINRCLGCYPGYSLAANRSCLLAPPPQRDLNCFQMQGGQCLQCFKNFHLGDNGICAPNNPLCREINSNGSCKSCYLGYILTADSCTVIPVASRSSDPYCVQTPPNSTRCILCVNGYYVSQNNKCLALSLDCLQHDMTTGKCLQCLPSYIYRQDQCISEVENCQTYVKGLCQSCLPGYFLKKGRCYFNDVTCASYDTMGKCTQCVSTYYLVNGQCIFPSFGFDPLCTNYVHSYCVECQKDSFLNNYRCRLIDKNCLEFDMKGQRCIKCAGGYFALGSDCLN